MANRTGRTPDRNTEFRMGDCYVWSEIRYLDSPTDYKESLFERAREQHAGETDLVMLDSSSVCWSGVFGIAIVFLAGVVGASFLVYLALTGF